MFRVRQLIGKIIGIVSGIIVGSMWAIAMWSGSVDWTHPLAVFVVAIIMLMLSIAVVIGSMREHHRALIFIFVASFFPIGLYLFTLDHWINWIGVLNIGHLLAGVLMWESNHSAKATN